MNWVSPVFENACTHTPKKPRLENSSNTDKDEEIELTRKSNIVNLDTWLSRHKPKKIEDCVVHKNKVNELKVWLKTAISNACSSKILLVTGPSGCGKTATLEILCKTLNVQIIEWITPLDTCNQIEGFNGEIFTINQNPAQVFKDFMLRASRYNNVLSSYNSCNKVILVKDFPNIFINKPSTFHDALSEFSTIMCRTPLVFISSDGTLCRDLFTVELKNKCNISTINFNPIVHSSIVKALQQIVDKEKKIKSIIVPSKNVLTDISSGCDGDLRSAILKLYFITFGKTGDKIIENKNAPRDKKGKLLKTTPDMDKKLDIFHGLGRVLYPKKEDISPESIIHRNNKGCYKFIHPPGEIVDTYSTQPNVFVGFLQENYLNTFTNISDTSFAADKLAVSDLLLSHWKGKELSHIYGLTVAVQGLMIANKVPLRAWNPMNKSNVYKANQEYKNHALRIKQTFPEFQSTPRDSFLDIIPFLKIIQTHKEEEQLKFIRDYSLKC